MSYLKRIYGPVPVSYVAGVHWIALLLGFAVLAAGGMLYWTGPHLIWLVASGCVLTALGLAMWKLTTELAVVDGLVAWTWAVFARQTIEHHMSPYTHIRVEQGPLGTLLNFGTVVVSIVSEQDLKVRMIYDPWEFKRQAEKGRPHWPMG